MPPLGIPKKQGLYDPRFEHDACGVGFVVDIKGRKSHAIVRQGLTVLNNLVHRGACGCEPNTGDGAGILFQIPHAFFSRVGAREGLPLPAAGGYGVGMIYLPPNPAHRQACEKRFESIVAEERQTVLGWRTVPTDNSPLGPSAKSGEPVIRQIFIGRNPSLTDDMSFERKLYVIRRRAENALRRGTPEGAGFYVASLSSRTIVYKGMLLPDQFDCYYPDLLDPDVASALALVHSRFSTNTFPNWERAHPYRYVIHNGEFNTLRGNVNWMKAREAQLSSNLFGDDLPKILPVIDEEGSDSAMFDNCFEFLVLAGRSLPHAAMMMIPEPWENHESISPEKKAFYEYHSCLMEPWDGPASICFTDGTRVGAVLDRNGLRPSRYYVTKDDLVVLASEVGVLDIPPERILHKGRLKPGRMLLIDTEKGRIVSDKEIKQTIAAEHPYGDWLKQHRLFLSDLPTPEGTSAPLEGKKLHQQQQAFGYSYEDVRILIEPMSLTGVEPIGSMGTDTPLAVLSERPQLLYNYFKQLFAQVTNPPIDAIREEIITSSRMPLGPERNLLNPEPDSCRQIHLQTPVLTNEELERIRGARRPGFQAATVPMLFSPSGNGDGGRALEKALEDFFKDADRAVAGGANILILSDRGVDAAHAPIPALLAVAGLHHHLIRQGLRTRVGLVVESGEPREVHHVALLIGYGASAVNPYLAYDTIRDLVLQNMLPGTDFETAQRKYVKSLVKGTVKTISKMGLSTVQSYRGAQIFEAVGLTRSVIEKYFTGTPSRVEGVGLDVLAKEAALRFERAFNERAVDVAVLDPGGQYQWRKDGEQHLFNPVTIQLLQRACRTNDYRTFKEYTEQINNRTKT
ncbi:MAG TPA: glutamate synthase central domain-containing protein, partial [Elusimicrobiota bacterium]|nr:glutamate synthase central domain-containing protein [Elusimicrobiota bacterium]